MEKYVVILSMKDVAIYNMIDGGPPIRYSFSSNGTLAVGEFPLPVGVMGSALLCDDYQVFAFGRKTKPSFYDDYGDSDGSGDDYRRRDRSLGESVLTVLDFF